ncbi:30S ribosomal protein [Wickerhamomyces ciferrii]|uniref:Small ribosomal subunit protein uS5m n=1 Tax=Wickerhamomyces ciferrii (strain ATCC 14091 / BCRC 22168 / CBS 111 / JCM 3599 / NBRC 0793 / NRRL Y-1031 F-60-10) TaxID=1206466 RepID=K0KVB5_WICCF|nr:30S ribosomal protein [Wickerhamomyces ciferrii]CCH45098.1 30S ribosomal protein [Wickerhamomyces ciferrii]
MIPSFKSCLSKRLGNNINSIRAFSNSTIFNQNQSTTQSTQARKEQHLNYLRNFYSDDLLESIKLAETVVSPKDYYEKKHKKVKFAPQYLDDFAKFDSFWDHAQIKEPHKVDWRKPLQVGNMSPPPGYHPPADASTRKNKNSEIAKGLSILTGLSKEYIEKLHVRPLIMKRVSNQTAKGKIRSSFAIVIVGDKNGMVGVGQGKDRAEMSGAVRKAHWNAVKNLTYIPRFEDRTIIGDIDHNYHGCKLHLRSAPKGFGLRVNHYLFEICEIAGIKDLSAKIYKSRNGMKIAKGIVEALSSQKTLEELSLNRGKKVVDLRKTYYSS